MIKYACHSLNIHLSHEREGAGEEGRIEYVAVPLRTGAGEKHAQKTRSTVEVLVAHVR